MARTKTRQRRSRSAPPASPIPDILTVARLLVRPQVLGTALVVLAAATLPYLLPLTGVIDDARDGVVRTLGLHAVTLVLLVACAGAVLALRRTEWLRHHWRHVVGAAALVIFTSGLLGRWYPDAHVGTVDLSAQSAGGIAGRRLTEGWIAAGWIGALVAGFALLWPRTALALARSSAAALWQGAVLLWRARLHRLAVRGFNRVFLRGDAASSEQQAGMAVSEWSPAIEQIAGPAEPSLAEAVERDAHEHDEQDEEDEPSITQIQMDMSIPAEQWRHSRDGWQLPPIELLTQGESIESARLDSGRRARAIEEALASFGVTVRVSQINEGPAVTQFGIEPGWDIRTRTVTERDASGRALLDGEGQPRTKQVEVSRTRVRVNAITRLQNDLALALAAPSLRIEAPVPGKQMLGIEVPNVVTTTVTLRGVLESQSFRKRASRAALPIALGADVSGEPVVADLAAMPHLLIAGATGSGKSVCLNAVITCLLMNHSPEQLRLVLIDPKRVELSAFGRIPHLAFSEIVVDLDRVVGTLQAVLNEMESRYRRFAQLGVRDLARYNEQVPGHGLPYWVVVIDELADLMATAAYQVESQVVRIAQLARATGIHLVIATQRPSVDVVTGLIKANISTRIAFAMSSQVDSRTVLDQAGAEKLLGRGDMLYQATDAQKPKRLQGVFVADAETDAVVDFWTADRFDEMAPEKHDQLLREAERQVEEMESAEEDDDDPMLRKALELAREANRVSTSMLQRRLRIGYPRAARIMDELESRGIVGPPEQGGSSRQVLMMPEGAVPTARRATEGDGFD